MMDCIDKHKYSKNFDDLSEREVEELLEHAVFCDYHNCLVTDYEQSVLPLLDEYYKEQSWLARLFRRINAIAFPVKDGTSELVRQYYLLKRSLTINLIQSLSILFGLVSFIVAFAIYPSMQKQIATNDVPQSENVPTQVAQTAKPDLNNPDNEILANETKVLLSEIKALLSEPKVRKSDPIKPKASKAGFQTYVDNYAMDELSESKDSVKLNEVQQKFLDHLRINKDTDVKRLQEILIEFQKEGLKTYKDDDNQKEQKTPTVDTNQEAKESVRLNENQPNQILIHKGLNQITLTDWSKTPQEISNPAKKKGMAQVTFRIIGVHSEIERVSSIVKFNDLYYEYKFVKNEADIYTFSVPKGSSILINVENSNKKNLVKDFYSVVEDNLDFEVPMDH